MHDDDRHPSRSAENSEEKGYRAVFEHVADAIIIHARDDHRILDVNPAAIKRLGYSREELRSMTPFDLHPSEELEIVGQKIDVKNPDTPNSWIHVAKDGTPIPVEILSDLIDYRGVPAWLSIVRDIRERREWEAKVAAARDAALRASAHKSAHVASLSHELRTPLNGITGMASLLLDGSLDDTQREYAETIQNAAHSMLELLNDTLDLAKIESGHLELDRVAYDLRPLAASIQHLLAARAQQMGIEFRLRLDPNLPAQIVGDPQRLRQVAC